jgi:hypothetical protein
MSSAPPPKGLFSSVSSLPPASGPQPLELRSLASVAVAILACEHPAAGRVSANVIVTGQAVRITWCAFCGAMSSDEEPRDVWQRPAVASVLSTAHLRELALVLHAVERWQAALSPAEGAAPAPLSPSLEQDLLSAITSTALYRDLERLDRALAARATAPPVVP